MTKLGDYLSKKSVNKSDVSRKTGISKARLSELTLKDTARLRVEELYLIALAIEVNAGELLEFVCSGTKLLHIKK